MLIVDATTDLRVHLEPVLTVVNRAISHGTAERHSDHVDYRLREAAQPDVDKLTADADHSLATRETPEGRGRRIR
jgi:hypothetical protein